MSARLGVKATLPRAVSACAPRAGALLGGALLGGTLLSGAWLGDTSRLARADADAPLARVGPLGIDATSLRQRAARAGEALRAFGTAWSEQRRRLLEEILIPEALVSLAAERAPAAWPPARDRVLARTLAATLADDAARTPPSDADVRAYRTRHEREFGSPRALALCRILVATEADARRAIAELSPPTLDTFSRIARERSIDRATFMRAGNLGLVSSDGQTAVPELRVSPALFAAADRVRDGELVPEPVPEGDAFAVVWRRSTRAATAAPEAEIRRRIADRLAEAAAAAARDALIERLRREHLSEYHPEALGDYEPSFPEVRDRQRAASVAEPSRSPKLVPEATDRGLR